MHADKTLHTQVHSHVHRASRTYLRTQEQSCVRMNTSFISSHACKNTDRSISSTFSKKHHPKSILCWYYILSTLDLRAEPPKNPKILLSLHGATRRSRISWHNPFEQPKVPSSTKITKMPLVNPRFDRRSTRSKLSQNNTFHSFTSNPSFSQIFGHFNQVWPEVDLGWA